jgi:NitT/TauT family transport system substrate-binding protein
MNLIIVEEQEMRMLRGFVKRCGRLIMSAAAALAIIGTSWSPAQAADKLTMRLEWTAWVMHLPLHLAMEKGWFKAADLDVYLEDGNGTITMVQLVGNGKFDLGHGALAAMAVGASKGLSAIALSEYLKKSPLGIIYSTDSGINSIKDLAGKKIIYTPASFESPFLEPFLTHNGIDRSSINLVGVEASAKISSYATGTGDAFVTTVPGDLPHVEGKRPSEAFLFADYGMNLPTFGIIANTDALKTKGDAIKRFTSVVSAAWAYILDGHVQEAAEATMKQRPNAPTSVARLTEEFKRHEAFFGKPTFPGLQDRDAWAKALKEMEAAKVIAAGTAPEKYFTNDYIDAAYGMKIVADNK